jgi:hypothetical protein
MSLSRENYLDEDDLEIIRDGSKNIIHHKRVSKKTNKYEKYYKAIEDHKKECGVTGGFKKGSKMHYDRYYENKEYVL